MYNKYLSHALSTPSYYMNMNMTSDLVILIKVDYYKKLGNHSLQLLVIMANVTMSNF